MDYMSIPCYDDSVSAFYENMMILACANQERKSVTSRSAQALACAESL
jgi:hypothetical protein